MKLKSLPQICLTGWLLFTLACQSAPPEPVKEVESPALGAEFAATVTPTPLTLIAPVMIKLAQVVPVTRELGVMKFGKLSLKQRLPANAEVSLVPLGMALPTIATRVGTAAAVENPCSESLPKLFETELKPSADATWLKAVNPDPERQDGEKAPFDVCVIYPAVAAVRALARDAFEKAQLPKKVLLHHIVAALDVTGDEQPEVLLVEYCCDKPQAQRNECDLTCSAVYVREANGQWRIAETQTPC